GPAQGLAPKRGGTWPDPLEGRSDQAAARGLRRQAQDRRSLDHADGGARGRQAALAELVAAPPQGREAAVRQSDRPVLLVQFGGPDAAARGAGARPGRQVARRGVAVERPGPVGRGGGAGLPQALERGALLLRRQATSGLPRAGGTQPQEREPGASDGVVRGQPGGAVVRPDG